MTPTFLNPTEQSLIAFLLFKHVAGAYPCPQEKCYGKRWGGRREQSGGLACQTHGICVPVLQCLIPRRIPRCSSCQLTELQLSTQTGHASALTRRSKFGLTHGISQTPGISELLYSPAGRQITFSFLLIHHRN